MQSIMSSHYINHYESVFSKIFNLVVFAISVRTEE